MDWLDIIILLWGCVFFIAGIAMTGYAFHVLKKDNLSNGLSLSPDDNRRVIASTLRKLNCEMHWTKENDKQRVRFNYQSGHFVITLEKGSPYARLSFPYIYSLNLDSLDNARMVVNLSNINSDLLRIIYTIDEKKGKIDFHICSVLPILRFGMDDLLERAMGDSFRWQKGFVENMEETEKKGNPAEELDSEKGHAYFQRELQIQNEMEMMHQDGDNGWHEDEQTPMTIGALLKTTMGIRLMPEGDTVEFKPIGMMLMVQNSDKVITLDDPQAIINFRLSGVIIENGTFKAEGAVALLRYVYLSDPTLTRSLTIDIEQDSRTKETLYYRVTISQAPLSINKAIDEDNELHKQKMVSVLLGYDLLSVEKQKSQFRYWWKEAKAMAQEGNTKEMTKEEKLLASMQDDHLAQNYFKGYKHFLCKRFYEALPPLRDAFNTVTRQCNMRDSQNIKIMKELAYLIGSCYSAIHQYEKANYYLQMLLPTMQRTYSEAYINCLVNSGDYRTLDVINHIIGRLEQVLNNTANSYDEENEDDDIDMNIHRDSEDLEKVRSFVNFLRRRKAYLLINLGRYEEARTLLQILLQDPENSDFALNELAYIQKKK